MSGDSKKFTPPDWRDVGQYRHLLDLDRAGWAWEWLRRHDAYDGERAEQQPPEADQAPEPRLVVLPAYRPAALTRWGLCFCCATKLPCHAGAVALERAI